MVLNNIPKRGRNKKMFGAKLTEETITQIHEISKERGISQAVLIEHLVAIAYQEFIKEQNQK